RSAELLAGIDGREIEFEIAILLGIGRQLVRPDRHVAPLEAFANVPDLIEAGAPGREMVERAFGLAEPLAADPFEAAARRVMAVTAGEVERADLDVRKCASPLIGFLCTPAPGVDLPLPSPL